LLTKRTYIFSVLVAAAIAFPTAALATAKGTAPKIGVADARPVSIAIFAPSVARFHRELRAGARRIRAERRVALARQRREAFASTGVSMATLESIASCESGGDPTAVSSDGSYRGKYQFDYGTWESVGGSGDPAAAPETEQDYRAALLYARSGSSPWPICGS
jgi:hypothetical protein